MKRYNKILLISLLLIFTIIYSYRFLSSPFDENSISNKNIVIKNDKKLSHLTLNTYILDSLEIASADLDSEYSWNYASEKCKQIGDGWRLPNLDELKLIFKKRKEIGGLKKNEKYWTSDIHVERTTAFEIYFNFQGFQDVSPLHSKLNVRAVKSIK